MGLPVDTAYEFIKEKIMDGSYYPSQNLIENELANTLGISRSTIKKALLRLERENLVTLETNKGAKVKAFSLEEIINYLEIREVLEGAILRRTASTISDEDLKKLSELIDKMKNFARKNQLDDYSVCNKQFHEIIYTASTNQEAVALVKQIKTQLQRLHLKTNLIPGRFEQSLQEHQNIFTALKNRDGKAAQLAVTQHVEHLRDTIMTHYQRLV
ncbi:GntR family transcriptional regulator [Desemzia sp. FAM 23989]|uniref:GntR family transcriptional regulator n=1 Tax=Desemzia sp. FAM 23989 TaxID=3259523 RepID=UPI003884931D